MENKPARVFLHCSATPDYPHDDPKGRYDLFGALDIDEWHRKRGWREIGYHAVIRRTGIIETGSRHYTEYGAHVQGANRDSLGFCYIGTAMPTPEQLNSILFLYGDTYRKFGITWKDWFGHYELDSGKTCPGFSMIVFRELLRQEHDNYLKGSKRIATINEVAR